MNAAFAVFVAFFCCSALGSEKEQALLDRWLAHQSELKSWSATVTQTRTFKTLNKPLVSSGKFWFQAPEQFRWELGDPPQTIALRQPEQMLVIYPRLKRAEKYPLGGNQSGQWKDTLSLLEAGFPRNRTDVESRFRINSLSLTNDICTVRLHPKAPSARRMMPELIVDFNTKDNMLISTELRFADGSSMHNRFTNQVANPTIDGELFSPILPEDYKLTEPLKR